jgi:hypothetical protein
MIASIIGYYEIDNSSSKHEFIRGDNINYFDIDPQKRICEVDSQEIETSCRDWNVIESQVINITKNAIKKVRESYAEGFRVYIEFACGDKFAKFSAIAYKGNEL